MTSIATQKNKVYGRRELAQLYLPGCQANAAWRRLKQWITLNKDLSDELSKLGYTGKQRMFTPEQTKAIFHYIGEP